MNSLTLRSEYGNKTFSTMILQKLIFFKTLTHYTYFCLMSDLNWSKVSSSLVILWGVGDWGQTRDEELPVMTLNQSQVRIVSE